MIFERGGISENFKQIRETLKEYEKTPLISAKDPYDEDLPNQDNIHEYSGV